MTLLVRDEADILPALLEYHLDAGVDFVIATDNRSSDATAAILRRYEAAGQLRYLYEPDDTYDQHRWVTRMARLAAVEHGADWVINGDADEFWWPETAASLREALAAVPADIAALAVPRTNFVALPAEASHGVAFWEAMVVRERESRNPLGDPLPPKVCHRGDPNVVVAQGNHEVHLSGGATTVASEALRIWHFPLRSQAQFENKIAKGGAAYERNRELDASVGNTWRRLYARYQREGLGAYYAEQVVAEPQLAAGRARGDLLVDTRLRERLRGLLPPARQRGARAGGRLARAGHRLRARRRIRRAGEGIVTLADANYFEGLRLLHASVRARYPVPIVCYDLGLDAEQRAYAEHHMPGVEIRPVPEDPEIAAIRERLDGPALAKTAKRQWPLWICPFLIAASPFRRTLWMDSDMVALRDLEGLYRALDDGPLFTPENLAPDKTPNPERLYHLLPIERDFERLVPLVNGGLSGWDSERDRGALEAYMTPIRLALERPAIAKAVAWHDQGCLIWAIQHRGLEHRVARTWRFNLCVRHTRAVDRPWCADDPAVLERLAAAAPQAAILHWNGSPVPWSLPSPASA